jgi:hypothetical protein
MGESTQTAASRGGRGYKREWWGGDNQEGEAVAVLGGGTGGGRPETLERRELGIEEKFAEGRTNTWSRWADAKMVHRPHPQIDLAQEQRDRNLAAYTKRPSHGTSNGKCPQNACS